MWTISAFAGGRASSRQTSEAHDDDERLPLGRALAVWAIAAVVGWTLTVGLVWAATSVSGG